MQKLLRFAYALCFLSLLLVFIPFTHAIDYDVHFQESSTDEGIGQSNQGWTNHMLYDPTVGRWYHFFIDSTSDIVVASSSDGVTFNNKTTIDAGTYDLDDFDVESSPDNTSELHIVYATDAADFLNYRLLTTSSSAPFISLGNEEIPFDASNIGAPEGNTSDDVAYPRVAIDSDGCVLIAFGMEDDSEATADEWEVVFIREEPSTTCGDGDFDEADMNLTVFSVQTADVGYNAPIPIGLKSYGTLDAQIFWIDTDTATAARLLTIYYNGTSQTFPDPEVELSSDIEFATTSTSYTSVIIDGLTTSPRIVTFGQDDTTTTLDAYILDGFNDTSVTQVSTGMDVTANTSVSGIVKVFLDTNSGGEDDLFLFGVNSTNNLIISSVNSTDGGTTWNTPFLFEDASTYSNEVKYLNGEIDYETCDLLIRFYTNASSPFGIYTKAMNTQNCIRPPLFCEFTTTCTSPNVTVFYAGNDTGGYNNAHIDINNQTSSYTYVLCCSSDDTHILSASCSNSSTIEILRAASLTDSHVQIPSIGTYSYGICLGSTYGSLECEYVNGTCSAGYNPLLSMASSEGDDATNAHVANYSYYTLSVCCRLDKSPPDAPTLLYPVNGNTSVFERIVTLDWTDAYEPDGDTVTYELSLNVSTGSCNVEHQESEIGASEFTTNELCTDQYYNWSVQACDVDGCSAWTSVWNFTIESTLGIQFLQNISTFADLLPGETNDTEAGPGLPMHIENTGNIISDVTLNATAALFTNAGLDTLYFQYKGDENEVGSYVSAQTTYANMSATQSTLFTNLSYVDANDDGLINYRVTVPADEPPGTRSTTVIVRVTAS